VVAALQAANLQVAAGAINQPPAEPLGAFQLSVQTLGRLKDPEQFGEIVIRADADGYVRVRDVARVELGAQDYTINTYLDRDPANEMACDQPLGDSQRRNQPTARKVEDRLWRASPGSGRGGRPSRSAAQSPATRLPE
jgi:Cu/Ag efflux pump CusA